MDNQLKELKEMKKNMKDIKNFMKIKKQLTKTIILEIQSIKREMKKEIKDD